MSEFITDDRIVSKEDLSRYRVLSGWEVNWIRSAAYWKGFFVAFWVFLVGIMLIWVIRYIFGI